MITWKTTDTQQRPLKIPEESVAISRITENHLNITEDLKKKIDIWKTVEISTDNWE